MRIAVVALGKIGLPLAVQYAMKGHDVIGVDVNETTVDLVNKGVEPFPGEAHLDEYLRDVVASGGLRATSSYEEAIPGADAVVLVVPLFVNDETWEPDFGWMDDATRSLATHLTENTLISYETTLPVGTTRNRWKPMIESISGLKEEQDFHLVFSPERVLTGRVFADLRKYPKLVGGLNDAGTAAGIAFYEAVLDFDERADLPFPNGVWDMGSAEASEMAKLAETTYRDVNIGLANQFAVYADKVGIDIERVIDACNSQPYSHIHHPGIAVGGHCIPVYPRLYLSTDPSMLGSLAGLRVAVLGASYRGGVKETAFSGVFATVDALRARGANVAVHDPMYSDDELRSFGWEPYHLGADACDCAIMQADHALYRTLTPVDCPGIRLLLDGRRVTSPELWVGVSRVVIGQ